MQLLISKKQDNFHGAERSVALMRPREPREQSAGGQNFKSRGNTRLVLQQLIVGKRSTGFRGSAPKNFEILVGVGVKRVYLQIQVGTLLFGAILHDQT